MKKSVADLVNDYLNRFNVKLSDETFHKMVDECSRQVIYSATKTFTECSWCMFCGEWHLDGLLKTHKCSFERIPEFKKI